MSEKTPAMAQELPDTSDGCKPRVYLNLTSGLEAAPQYPGALLVRIQSSHFESYALWKAVCHLDYQFLIDAAVCGVVLVDCGSRRSAVSRAQWQGVLWFRYAFRRANRVDDGTGEMRNEFARVYESSQQGWREDGVARLRYVGKMTGADDLRISCESHVSTLDGDYSALSDILEAHMR